GSFWTGTLPAGEPAANTTLRWSGRTWAVVVWPPVADSLERQVLVAHELWHRVQDSLGFSSIAPANSHLGTADGRLWLRLEGRALAAALARAGAARVRALSDAVAFRRARRALFPGSEAAERALELNEGLAEYSGVVLAAGEPETRRRLVQERLGSLDSAAYLERSFAYHTGPAWGLFLDELAPSWRRTLTAAADLGWLAERALGRATPAPRSAVQRGTAYGYSVVRKNENARATARRKRSAALRERFLDGPVLELPLGDMKMSFDPGKVEALDSLGSIYGMLRLADRWGVLQCDVTGGLIAGDFRRALVPAPADTEGRRLTGPGWILELEPGWRVVPGGRRGDWVLREIP
ncbi:MAG TPA: hypothetical protein VF187_10295, partial [Gemmatimonadales bacterium]